MIIAIICYFFPSICLVPHRLAAKNICNNYYIEGDIDSFPAAGTPQVCYVTNMAALFKRGVCPFLVLTLT